MSNKFKILSTVLFLIIIPFTLFAESYEEMWKKFYEARNKRLPQTAIKELIPIYEKAIKENEPKQAVKALTEKITLESEIQGGSLYESIINLEKAIETSDKSIQPMLKIILAKWYYAYYTRNRYKFINRTRTSEDTDIKDFRKWDLPKLFAFISKLYDLVLENEDELSKVPLNKFYGFIEKGNQPEEIVSNLFEFFVHDALDFYCYDDQTSAKPQIAFEINADSKVFGSIDDFISWNPETLDKESSNYKALKLYQRLLRLNKSSNNTSALVYNDLERIKWANKVAVGQEKNERYLLALECLASQYPNNPYTPEALLEIAQKYKENNDFVKAVDYCERTIQKAPNSRGALRAKNMLQDIKDPYIFITSDKIITNYNNKIKIRFKNLNHIYFRIIKREENDIIDLDREDPDYYDTRKAVEIIDNTPVYEFETNLDPESDYNYHEKIISFPKMEKGGYWVVCSTDKSFDSENSIINLNAIIISDIAFVARTGLNGKSQIFVVDSYSGKPISEAKIRRYRYDHKNRSRYFVQSHKTNSNGLIEFKSNYNELIFCEDNSNNKAYRVVNFDYRRENEPETCIKYFTFTDRAIYRPGQTVYFKVIAVNYNKSINEYKVLKDHECEVQFKDANSRLIKNIMLKTNSYGSINGSFIIPTDRLPGEYSLKVNNINENPIRVEEYKRPKFKVNIDAPKEEYQLGQIVKVKGHAFAYSGSNIDFAEVKYRVVRLVRYPRWCWWIPRNNNSQEICNGTTKTNENGEFIIEFEAKPDKKIGIDSNPIFRYSITADITDNTGETRSASKDISIGYSSMELFIDSPQKYNADKDFNLSLTSKTHDGIGIQSEGKIIIYQLEQPQKPDRFAYDDYDDYDNYEITDIDSSIRKMKESKVVFEEKFTSDIDGKYNKSVKLPEGIYRIKAFSEDKYGKEVKVESNIIAISYTSKTNTIKLPFIFEVTSGNLKPGDSLEAFWATGYEAGPAYIEICHKNNPVLSYWINSTKNKQFISFPVDEDMRGGFYVRVFQVKENRLYETSYFAYVPWTNKDLNIKLVHFNSKMEPGSKESWKIEVSGEDAEMQSIEMLASMYDASLDAFVAHSWNGIDVFYRDYTVLNNVFSNKFTKLNNCIYKYKKSWFGVPQIILPSFPRDLIPEFQRYMVKSLNEYTPKPPKPVPSIKRDIQTMQVLSVNQKTESVSYSESSSDNKKEEKKEIINEIDLSKIKARNNFNETAFFMPQLTVNNEGIVSINFQMPEALTTWKFMGFAHGTKLQNGLIQQKIVTQKELMIQPNAPRFIREGDKIEFSVKVTNLTEQEQSGVVALDLLDAITDKSRNDEFKNQNNKKSFIIPAKQSRGFSWLLDIPYKPGFVKYRAVGATKRNSDGEEALLPILSSRILVTESLPLPIRGNETKNFSFEKLIKFKESKTLEPKALTVEMTSNPAWYAIQALPYLIEFPHECSEQVFNRIYANKLASHIANSDPKIRRVFDIWAKDEQFNKGTALISNLEKNEHLKSVTLMETPWILDATKENEQKHKIGILFQKDRIEREIELATKKLKKRQNSNGSFAWFPGGEDNPFITFYIMTGYGRLRHLGTDIDLPIALNAVNYVDNYIYRLYNLIIKENNYERSICTDSITAFYLYGRSFFLNDKKIPNYLRAAIDFYLKKAKEDWPKIKSRMTLAHLAIALWRFGDKETPLDIVKSIKEHSVTDEEMGRFWRDKEFSYTWDRAEIETQAMMIELFSEITNDEKAVEECKIWMLKQKQTSRWKTTKSTADAIYAIILRGTNLLASDKLVKVYLAEKEVKPEKVEAGTGYYQKIYSGDDIKPEMGNVKVVKEDKGVAWGALHWQYIEDTSKITPFENNLKLKKTLFIKKNTEKGPVLSQIKDGKVRVGDLVVVRIELETDRNLEFVHLKDSRGSGMEPVNVISKYKRQDSLSYYEAIKDCSTNFYFDRMRKGTYIFEYEVRVQLAGQYQTGIAEIMCMYAPEFNSHSESFWLNVEAQ